MSNEDNIQNDLHKVELFQEAVYGKGNHGLDNLGSSQLSTSNSATLISTQRRDLWTDSIGILNYVSLYMVYHELGDHTKVKSSCLLLYNYYKHSSSLTLFLLPYFNTGKDCSEFGEFLNYSSVCCAWSPSQCRVSYDAINKLYPRWHLIQRITKWLRTCTPRRFRLGSGV